MRFTSTSWPSPSHCARGRLPMWGSRFAPSVRAPPSRLPGASSQDRARNAEGSDVSGDSFGARDTLTVAGREYEIHRLDVLQEKFDVARLPYSLKVLLENALRLEDGGSVTASDVCLLYTSPSPRDGLLSRM